mgnify:CR=1 FL=1
MRVGTIVGGTGSAPVTGNVAIAGSTIVGVGNKIYAPGAKVITGDGRARYETKR